MKRNKTIIVGLFLIICIFFYAPWMTEEWCLQYLKARPTLADLDMQIETEWSPFGRNIRIVASTNGSIDARFVQCYMDFMGNVYGRVQYGGLP